jgi:dTDP-4-dehydrorhamnose reductase
MILLLGGNGYVGRAFQRALQRRGWSFVALSRATSDYTRSEVLLRVLEEQNPDFLINAAGYTGKPNVDACERARADTLLGNVVLPQTISQACAVTQTPWGHVSSGCIYNGAIIAGRIRSDLTAPDVQRLIATEPGALEGFRESDRPNFGFRDARSSFYSGSKALAEEVLADDPRVYLWRLRIPFNQLDDPRNYLTKLQTYAKVYDNANSLSHLDDFADACLELRARRAPFGSFNVTNPGYVTTRQVVQMIQALLPGPREFVFWENDQAFYREAAQAPRSNCILSTSKMASLGVKLRRVEDALSDALSNWKPAS